jgi:iron complex outermembrane receptor protein
MTKEYVYGAFAGVWATFIATSFALAATPAPAAVPAADAEELEEVTVTGSRIRGVAPVGSPVITVDRQKMEESGVAQTNDFLRQVPSITTYGIDDASVVGGNGIQNSQLNVTFGRSINLRGLGTASTLTLINGHRAASAGANANYFDADAIPAAAIERLEVVADGASAIYGSDAVAGVVNMVLRKNFNGAETTLRYGGYSGAKQSLLSHVMGKTWTGGSVTFAVELSRRDPLFSRDRLSLYSDNLLPYGGTVAGQFTASPGNVTVAGVNYGIPRGQNGQSLLLGQLSSASNFRNTFDGQQVIPKQQRKTFLVTVDQKFSERFSGYFEAFNSDRDFSRITGHPTSTVSVPATNTFSPCFAGRVTTNTFGIGCAANLTVPYSLANDIGLSRQPGYENIWDITAGLKFGIAGSWSGEASITKSKADGRRLSENIANGQAITAAATGTVTYKGVTVTKPATVPFLNPFCDGTAFANCNDPATIAYIRAYQDIRNTYTLDDYNLKADGSLFGMPGGDVRLAIGAEYRKDDGINRNTNTTGGISVGEVIDLLTSRKRTVKSYFAELYVPIVGAGNARTGIKRLDLSLAARSENYSDFGSTSNPKIGVTWEPITGFGVHATYGKSFRAPTLCDINPDCTVRIVNGANFAPADVAAIAAGNPGSVGVTGTKNYLQTGGGSNGLQPEKATTYSFGVHLTPELFQGFDVEMSYYNIKYTNRLDTPGEQFPTVSQFTSPALYQGFLTLNPNFFPTQAVNNLIAKTPAEWATYLNSIANSPFITSTVNQANVLGVVNGNRLNTGKINTNGIDLNASYSWRTGLGQWTTSAIANYVLTYQTSSTPIAPLTEQVNHFGYPLKLKVRAELGWRGENWNVTGFVNYANAYALDASFMPNVANKALFTNISSNTTADLTINYNTGDKESGGWLNGVRVSLNIQNLLNRDPPFALNGTNLLFDPQNGSASGRTTSVQLTKKW